MLIQIRVVSRFFWALVDKTVRFSPDNVLRALCVITLCEIVSTFFQLSQKKFCLFFNVKKHLKYM